jgi:predicted alpha/beta-fold hydrolase
LKAAGTYHAPGWLPGGHAQTLWPLLLKGRLPAYRRERWETPDADFIDIDWIDGPPAAPLLVLFHGLEGSSRSHYARQLMRHVSRRGWRGAVVHFRGCSGEPNQLARAYHSGDSAEIDWVLRRMKVASADQPLFAAGVSLGGNALLKWLGEQETGAGKIIAAAAAISAPLDLAAANEALSRGFSLVYARHFLATLIPKSLAKLRRFPGLYDPEAVKKSRTLYDFDDAVTAPLHGFRDADDYYPRPRNLQGLRHPRHRRQDADRRSRSAPSATPSARKPSRAASGHRRRPRRPPVRPELAGALSDGICATPASTWSTSAACPPRSPTSPLSSWARPPASRSPAATTRPTTTA